MSAPAPWNLASARGGQHHDRWIAIAYRRRGDGITDKHDAVAVIPVEKWELSVDEMRGHVRIMFAW